MSEKKAESTLYQTKTISEALEEKKNLLKTLLENEKMLVTSIFSFSNNVFYPIKDILNVLRTI